jgi:hypothetical protein
MANDMWEWEDMDADSAFDDSDFDLSEDDEFDDAEMELAESRSSRRGRSVSHARSRGRYSQRVQGKSQGLVKTPQGTAKVALPGTFPTVEELRKTVDALQGDIRKNSAGIMQLKRQMELTERRLTKRAKNAQIASLVAISIPLVALVVKSQTKSA